MGRIFQGQRGLPEYASIMRLATGPVNGDAPNLKPTTDGGRGKITSMIMITIRRRDTQ